MPQWSRAAALAATVVIGAGIAAIAHETMSRPGESRDDMLMFAARSYSESRAGDIFAFPRKYSFVAGRNYSYDGWSNVRVNGKVQKFPNGGMAHGLPWDYDTRIPIMLYGPGFIKPGQVSDAFATQQDITPTIAALIGTASPEDTRGRVLHEAFRADVADKKPKAVLTLVFDQGGMENYYEAQPDAWPELKALMARGTFFRRAKVTQVDAETGVGHTSIGTGAYPAQHGIVSNGFWRRELGESVSAFKAELSNSPGAMESPTLIDVWNRASANKAINIAYCYADRAALGMGGHGRLYSKDSHNLVFFYDDKTGKLKTNDKYYDLPKYVADMSPEPYWTKATGGTNTWMGHQFGGKNLLASLPLTTPFVDFDADVFMKVVENEPIGQDDVPDLLYLTLKSTDACGHAFGAESEECIEVFHQQDMQAGRIIKALEAKVGADNLVVILTADHGGPPLPELKGGHQVRDTKLIEDMNKHFDRLDNGVPLVEDFTATQVFVDDVEMARLKLTWNDIKRYLEDYQVGGKRFFFAVFTKDEVRNARIRAGLF